MKRIEIEKVRVNYYGGASFWACEATEENKKALVNANIFFWTKTFKAANGMKVSRLEWND